MKNMFFFAPVLLVVTFYLHPARAQQRETMAAPDAALLASAQPAAGVVPRVVRFNGTLHEGTGDAASGVAGLICSLYELPEGGTPLWSEEETVKLDEQGRYTVLLGASLPDGLPVDLFAAGKALWLGVQAQQPGAAEQPRVALVAVPYALKAAEADKLGGKSAEDFVLASQLKSAGQGQVVLANAGRSEEPAGGAVSAPQKTVSSNASSSGIQALNALTTSTQTIATGKSGTDFNVVSSGSTHTFNIPDASASARGLVNTAAQTFAGDKSFGGNVWIRGPSPYIDVKAYGAMGNGLTNDTTAIQNAINAAGSAGSIVFFPPGIYLVSQIVVQTGVSLTGSGINMSPNGLGTELKQMANVNEDMIVSGAVGYQHWSVISNMYLCGDPSNTSGSGIHYTVATGEGASFIHLMANSFAANGILIYGGVPLYMQDIHTMGNGLYGVNVNPTGAAPSQTYLLTMISGDDNGKALIHLGPSPGVGGGVSWTVNGVKSEKHTPGKQNDTIVLDTMNGSPVTIHGVAVVNNSGEAANSVIKIINASARLSWSSIDAMGLPYYSPGPCSGNCVNYTVNDNSGNGFNSIRSSGTYDGDFYVNRLSANYGSSLSASDFSLSGWGSGAQIFLYSNSADQRGQVQILPGGSGIGTNPTVTLTFHDGTWHQYPFAVVGRNDTCAPAGAATWSINPTTLTITFQGTPVAGCYYTFTWLIIG
jgi:hypothetical protein